MVLGQPQPRAGSETQQSQNLPSKPNISPQKKVLPYNEKIPFFLYEQVIPESLPQPGKGNVCPVATHIRLTDLMGFFFFFFLLLTHRIFINFLVSINPAACYFWGERKGDVHFLHSVGLKICFLKFILNIAGSKKTLWLFSGAGLSHQLGWMILILPPLEVKCPQPHNCPAKLPHLPRHYKKNKKKKSEII